MIRLIFLLIATSLLAVACNNKAKTNPEEKAAQDAIEKITKNPEALQDNLNEMQKEQEALQKLPPLSMEELKKLIPEELLGAKRTSYAANAYMGTGMANAEYRINDSSEVKLMVYDCGGPAGAGIYGTQYLGLFNMESENETEYTKTISYGGGKAIENCRKDRAHCTLTYFGGKRFMVTLEGDNVGIDALKQAGNSLKL